MRASGLVDKDGTPGLRFWGELPVCVSTFCLSVPVPVDAGTLSYLHPDEPFEGTEPPASGYSHQWKLKIPSSLVSRYTDLASQATRLLFTIESYLR